MLLELTFYVLGVLALAAAFQSFRMLTAVYLGEGRYWTRRLSRRPDSSQIEMMNTDERGRLEALLDLHVPIIRRQLRLAGLAVRSDQIVAGTILFALLLILAARIVGLGWSGAFFAGAPGLFVPVMMVKITLDRRRKRFLAQMPQTVDLIARSLQAGHPVTTAISVASQQMPDPIGPELAMVVAEMKLGLDRDQAFRHLLKRFPLPEMRLFVASLEVTRETGGNVAEVLLKLSDTMRAKAQLRKKVRAISAEGRLTLIVVSVLPAVVALGISLAKPGYYTEVAGNPLFWRLMAIPPVLVLLGTFIIWRMINFKV